MDKKRVWTEFRTAVFASAGLSFMVGVYAPVELYCTNKRDFWFDFYGLVPVMAMLFLVIFAISILILAICFKVHRGLYQAGLVEYFIFYICTYIQGNFLVKNLPSLDGERIFWGNYGTERLKGFVVWLAVTAIVVVLLLGIGMKRLYGLIQSVSVFVTLILLVTAVCICVENDGFLRKKPACITNYNEFTFSEDANFIILVLDTMDSHSFRTVLEDYPECSELLEDFTYYPDTIGAYCRTLFALPHIISGVWYENERPVDEYLVEAYDKSPILDKLQNQAYRLGMYTTELPLIDDCVYKFENVKECESSLKTLLEMSGKWIKLVGYKYAGFDLKKYCVLSWNDFWEDRPSAAGTEPFHDSNLLFYGRLLEEMPFSVTQEKCFKFIHLEGAHTPFPYDENMNRVADEEGNQDANTRGCVTMVAAFVEKLKECGAYDNSVLIVMSDHGYMASAENSGAWNPVLMIKGIGETHEFTVDKAPISYDDLQEAFERLLNGAVSEQVFDWKEGDVRQRRHLYYEGATGDEHMYELIQQGSPDDIDSAVPTGREFVR